MSFHVFLFCCCRSNTVLSVLFFFGIHSIGVACFSAAGTHHPAVVYCSIFWASSEWNTSGHLGSLCLCCFDSLIKGISCDTSRNGGNFSGSGPNKSLYFSAIFHITEECLNVCIHSGFSLNPLTSGSDSLYCPSCHSLWDLTFWIVIRYLYEELLVPLVSMLSLKRSF